jgi:hypothetical protein
VARRRQIFERTRLTAGQLRAVAEKRLGDARCLLASRDNGRCAGACYLAGFVIECLLKALILERRPGLGRNVDPARLPSADRYVLDLLYSHNLPALLDLLPEARVKLTVVSGQDDRAIWLKLNALCAEWTIFARYSPRDASRADAERFVNDVGEVKPWLQEL